MKLGNFKTLKRKVLFVLCIAMFLSVIPSLSFAITFVSTRSTLTNIRRGPGTKYDVSWKAWKYTPLRVIGEHGNWYKVKDFENDIGWIHKTATSIIPSVIVKTEMANFRTEPSMKSQEAFQVKLGHPFKFVQEINGWYKVVDLKGKTGWISKSVVWGFTKSQDLK
jgi:SH3-like domain-containing protein